MKITDAQGKKGETHYKITTIQLFVVKNKLN